MSAPIGRPVARPKLMLTNHIEIELARVATEKASNSEVKQFAQKLIEDHSRLNEQLAKFAPDSVTSTTQVTTGINERGLRTPRPDTDQPNPNDRDNNRGNRREQPRINPEDRDVPRKAASDTDRPRPQDTQPNRGDDPQQPRTGATQPNRGDDPQQTSVRVSSDMMLVDQLCQIDRQAAQIHLQAAKQLLGEYQGQDFDMGFLGMQIAAHTSLRAKLTAISDVGTPEFQQIVKAATSSVDQHLEMAKQLSERLEDDRRPGRGTDEVRPERGNTDQPQPRRTQNDPPR
jgi:predicted outer membrane protein